MLWNATMEITSLSSSVHATTHFTHPPFKKKLRLKTLYHCTLKITRPSAPYTPLKPKLPPKPPYKTHQIPQHKFNKNSKSSYPVEKERIFRTDFKQTTSSDVLRLMDGLGLIVTPDIYTSFVVECTKKRDAVQATELFTHMKRNYKMVGFLNRRNGLLLLNRILTMLVVCGCLDDAHQLFDEMPHRDSISLAIMIGVLVKEQHFEEALGLFGVMHQCFMSQQSEIALEVVVVCVMEACVHLKNISLGKVVHGWLLKMGYGRELFVGIALVEFYGNFRCLSEANSVFYEQIRMSDHCDTRLWAGALVNNCRGGNFASVISIFHEMGRAGVIKNEFTFLSVLKACGRVSDDGFYGRQVHANAIKLALDTHILVLSGLIDMYGRCGLLNDARKVFNMIGCDKRNRACWDALITGFLQHGLCIEAIKMLYQMKAAGVQPQESLIDKVRVACGSEKLCMNISQDM